MSFFVSYELKLYVSMNNELIDLLSYILVLYSNSDSKFIRKIILHLNIHTIQLKNTDTIIKIVDTVHVCFNALI